jgi:hypothetical protein
MDTPLSEALDATAKRRLDLQLAVERLLAPEPCVQGVVAVGSVATGHARPGSDIDAIVFMEPFDPYIVPTESIWCPWDNTFHSIFVKDPRIQKEGIQLDLKLVDLSRWSDWSFIWPEPQRAGLVEGWVAFDREGNIGELIRHRTAYDDVTRLSKLDRSILDLSQHLSRSTPEDNWERCGPFISFGRLAAANDALAEALFAVNRRWRFFRDRETEFLLRLPWLPKDFELRMLIALNAPSIDEEGFLARVAALRQMFDEILAKVRSEPLYGPEPVAEAFVRMHDEPGRAWNMDEWNQMHNERKK